MLISSSLKTLGVAVWGCLNVLVCFGGIKAQMSSGCFEQGVLSGVFDLFIGAGGCNDNGCI